MQQKSKVTGGLFALLNTVGGGLNIYSNFGLLNITGLKNPSALGGPVEIRNNYHLAECSIPPICQRLFNDPASINIQFNATGCQTPEEVEDKCGTTPVFVSVKTDADGDCLPDAANLPVEGGAVWLSAPGQATLRPTDAAGICAFRYFNNGPLAADFDCRQVALLKSHTGKNAFPAGVGPDRLLPPNRPLRYTIDFHNGEAEEINSVSIRDLLPPELDLNAIRPGAASHPYTWEIRKGNVLQVKFDPIQLGDSLGDPADAHGFFTFEINQQPDLPDGVVLQNVSETFFGNFFPSRDTAWHTISKTGANNQKCLPTTPGFGFYTQEHIDNFPVNYPGCTEIEGDLIIGEFQNDITNLNGFSQLRSVGGSLRISNCESLQSLNGLNNLRNTWTASERAGLASLPPV